MKILVIFTGGTIGSKLDDGWIGTDAKMKYKLLDAFASIPDVEFSTLSPYTILSENLSNQELVLLQNAVCQNLDSVYDGIIITHGTDTLQYSAAALEYAVAGCKIPIIFVSAAYPLDDPRTNGYANFEAALEFIRARAGSGVFVSYKNEISSAAFIYRATRVIKHAESSSDIFGIDPDSYAEYRDRITLSDESAPSVALSPLGVVEYVEDPRILVVSARPGDGFGYSLEGVNAILLEPYHSSTLNTSSRSFLQFCKTAKDKGIPIFLLNTKDGAQYASSKLFDSFGIRSSACATFVSAYMKIWAAISLGRDIVEFMSEPISYEML